MFWIAICGGGIGGLTLALAIAKYGTLLVEIFKAGPMITTTSAGIGLYARAMDILKELGLYDELVKMAIGPPQGNSPIFRKSDQQDRYHWFTRDVPGGCLFVHRQDLVNTLLRHIPASCKIQTSKRLEFYEVNSMTEQITLRFSDGSHAIADVLVGSDSIRSATRKTMYQNLALSTGDKGVSKRLLDCIDPVWTGLLVYRSLIPTRDLHSTRPLPHYVNGNIVLLGDAAHAMEPHFGAGAAQAMEDAIVLGRLLTHRLTHRKNVTDALKTYEQICLPFANSVVQRSQDVGRYYGFQRLSADEPAPGHDSPEELDHLRKCIEDAWEWQCKPARVWGETEELWRMRVNGSMSNKL